MKKKIKIWGLLLSILVCVQTVQADVIWEPEDSFYNRHSGECEYLSREYGANGPEGKVIVYQSPVNAKEVAIIENGTHIWITWTYKDAEGIIWGYYHNDTEAGWLPMDYMSVVYDYISFEEDYGDEFVTEAGQLTEFKDQDEIKAWKYPGSKESETMILGGSYQPEYSKTYVDADGNKWGYCTYYQGYRNFWIFLEDPAADYIAIYGEMAPEPEVEEEKQEDAGEDASTKEPIVPSPKKSFWGIGISVFLVAAVTAILLVKMRKGR